MDPKDKAAADKAAAEKTSAAASQQKPDQRQQAKNADRAEEVGRESGAGIEHKRSGVGEGGYAPADPRSQHEQATPSAAVPVRDSVTGEVVAPAPKMEGNYREASQRAAEERDSRTGTEESK